MDLTDITAKFIAAYDIEKKASTETKTWKKAFFESASKKIEEEETLAQQSLDVAFDSEPDAQEYVKIYHPGWRIASTREDKNGKLYVIIEEDPNYRKFVWINENLGLVFQRNITQQTPELDDERLRANDFELWTRITTCPVEEWLVRYKDEAKGDITPQLIKKFIENHRNEFERILNPSTDWDEQDMGLIQGYLVPGSLSVRMETPRAAKESDL